MRRAFTSIQANKSASVSAWMRKGRKVDENGIGEGRRRYDSWKMGSMIRSHGSRGVGTKVGSWVR